VQCLDVPGNAAEGEVVEACGRVWFPRPDLRCGIAWAGDDEVGCVFTVEMEVPVKSATSTSVQSKAKVKTTAVRWSAVSRVSAAASAGSTLGSDVAGASNTTRLRRGRWRQPMRYR
jgi:hypothetical protein